MFRIVHLVETKIRDSFEGVVQSLLSKIEEQLTFTIKITSLCSNNYSQKCSYLLIIIF